MLNLTVFANAFGTVIFAAILALERRLALADVCHARSPIAAGVLAGAFVIARHTVDEHGPLLVFQGVKEDAS